MSEKTPLVLVPGLLCDGALWRYQAEHLADIAAVGVADVTGHDSMEAMAQAVIEAAPAGRFALAGLSMGGYVAFEIMRQAPERVARLALFDTSARSDTAEQIRRRTDLMELARKGKFKGVTKSLLELFLHPDRLHDTPLTESIMAMAERVGRDAFLRQQEAIKSRADSRPTLAALGDAIDCPTLVACGRQDTLTPLSWSEEIAAGIPGAKLVAVEDCGHMSTMERPEATTALMRDWLQE